MKTHFLLLPTLFFVAMQPLAHAQEPVADTARQYVAGDTAGERPHPFYGKGFYPQWSAMTPEAAAADLALAEASARKRLQAIAAIEPGRETWAAVFEAYAYALQELECMENYTLHMEMTMGEPEMRMLAGRVSLAKSDITAEALSDAKLYEVVQRAAARPWVQDLSPAKRRYIQTVLDAFRTEGAGVPPAEREAIRLCKRELGWHLSRYRRNIGSRYETWYRVITDPAQLDGMSAEWMESAAQAARRRGFGTPENPQWIITLDYNTSAGEVMQHCTVEATRRMCWEGRMSVGATPADNAPEIAAVMAGRQRLAALSGYKDYADMVCKDRMVGGGERALAFVDDMTRRLQPALQRDVRTMLDYISARTGGAVESVNPWDAAYYSNLYAKEHRDFDRNSVRPYLRSDNVLRGMLATFSAFYDITITGLPVYHPAQGGPCPVDAVEVWAPGVSAYKVTDNKTGAHLGSFYLDPSARPGKKDGSWFFAMRLGRPGEGGAPREPHLMAVTCNLTPPSDKGYALYSLDEVKVLFHEFGHALHILLGDAEVAVLALERSGKDFIELPSRLHENWACEPEVLRTFAFHHETGEPIPEELLQKLLADEHSGMAVDYMSQIGMAKLDLEIHMHYAEQFATRTLDEASQEILRPYGLPLTVGLPSVLRRAEHCLSGGYAAGYYSYIWGDMLAADIFARIKERGLLDPETGAALRECIFKPGDGVPAMERHRRFMGRDPEPDALLERFTTH